MNMKQRGCGVEISKLAVNTNGVQDCTGVQTKLPPTTPYIGVHAKLRKFGVFSGMVQMLHYCKVHLNMKQTGWGVEIWKPAVGVNGTQTCKGLQTKALCSTPYSAVFANLSKFRGIFGHDADVAPMQGAHEHEAKRMGS